jgi:hypothetical protein
MVDIYHNAFPARPLVDPENQPDFILVFVSFTLEQGWAFHEAHIVEIISRLPLHMILYGSSENF